MPTISVNSISLLEELETSITRFADKTKDAIDAIQREIQVKTELLNRIVAERRRAVAELQEAYDEIEDEEDGRLIGKKLEKAEEELREAKRWQRRVEEVCAAYKKHLQQAYYLADNHSDKSRRFLRARVKDLYDYVGLKPRSAQAIPEGRPEQNSDVGDAALTSLPLPTGFQWISFDDLPPNELQQLPDQDEYRKGLSEADMQEGLRLLQTRVLPEIQKDASAATIEHFLDLDMKESRSGPNSLANVFAAYFGDSRIHVSRMQGDRYFTIGNGRHRIKAARDLGWNSVPGHVAEVPKRQARSGL